jgi:preprotein translocase subunit SecG
MEVFQVDVLKIVLTVMQILLAVFLVGFILFQSGKQQGLSGVIAGSAETFFGKGKTKTTDALLKKFTAISAIVFLVTSIALEVIITKV